MQTAEAKADDRRAGAEIAIEKILHDLERETGRKIDRVSTDTRNFARFDVEISFLES